MQSVKSIQLDIHVSSRGDIFCNANSNTFMFSIFTKNWIIFRYNSIYLTHLFGNGDAVMVNCINSGGTKFDSYTPMLQCIKS